MRWERTATTISSASPEAVWRVLVDGPHWARWNERAAWMWVEQSLVPGNLVTIKPKHGRQTAYVIDEVLEGRRLALRLTFGPVAALRLSWTLEPASDGTRLEGRVAIDGIAASFLVKKMAQRAAAAMLADLVRLAACALE